MSYNNVQQAILDALARVSRGNVRILTRETGMPAGQIRSALRTLTAANVVISELHRGRLIVRLNPNPVKPITTAPVTPTPLSSEQRLREIVHELLRDLPPLDSSFKVVEPKSGMTVTIKVAHIALKEVLRRINAGFSNFLLVGPAGSGKSTLARQVAESLKLKYGFASLSGGTTEGQLLGRMSSVGKYIPAACAFVERYEKSGVFLLDEVDGADANMLLVLNSALANGELAVTNRNAAPVAKRHARFILICAANTYGSGADFQYVGRNQLDAAFLSRFAGAVITMDYDETLERTLVAQHGGTEEWYEAFRLTREKIQANRLRRVFGTRELLAGTKLMVAGYTQPETFAVLMTGWSRDEIGKAGF